MRVITDDQDYPIGCECDCGHKFAVDPCTEENVVTVRQRRPDGKVSRVNVSKCPNCGQRDVDEDTLVKPGG